MKLRRLLFALMVATLGFVSCSKSDSNSDQPVVTLEGKWQFTKEGTIANNQEVLNNYEHTAGCTKDYIEILTSNVVKDHYFDNPNCQETIDTGSWTKNNNFLTIVYPNITVYSEILELSATTLKLKYANSGTTYVVIFTRI